MQTMIEWKRPADTMPPSQVQVLGVFNGQVRLCWYGGWDERWRVGSTYCAAPRLWAALPEVPRAV